MLINLVNMPCCTVTMFIYSPPLGCMIYKYIVIILGIAQLNVFKKTKHDHSCFHYLSDFYIVCMYFLSLKYLMH